MSVSQPVVIDSGNLSMAWGLALLRAYETTNRSVAPIVVSVNEFSHSLPAEDVTIREATDAALERCGKNPIRVSALTIFPFDMWCRRGKPCCEEFSALCVNRLLPRLKRLDRRNRLGTYFARMMAYNGIKGTQEETVNQLSFVIELLKNRRRWPRQSALQLACFDPPKDHSRAPVRGFPCLQQASVTHDGRGRIAINAYYPTQYIFDRGYGNYLGLCHLGAFLAHEAGLELTRFNCFVGRPELGDVSKSEIKSLVQTVAARISQHSPAGGNHGN